MGEIGAVNMGDIGAVTITVSSILPIDVDAYVISSTHVALTVNECPMSHCGKGATPGCSEHVGDVLDKCPIADIPSHPVYCTWFDISWSNLAHRIGYIPIFPDMYDMPFCIRILICIPIFKHSKCEKWACLFDILFAVSPIKY